MNPAFQRYVEAASGLTNLTAKKAEQVARSLVRSGAAAGDQIGELTEDLMERQRRNREALAAFVRKESERAVGAMGLTTRRDQAALERRIDRLEAEIRRLGGSTARKSTAKKA
ncbi:MAG: phasin family protein, partial [Nitriliruptoraceae bacterium]